MKPPDIETDAAPAYTGFVTCTAWAPGRIDEFSQ
jgi:hypothetical protein